MASRQAKKLQRENSKLFEELIVRVTGLKKETDEENFKIATRYVHSVFDNRPFRDFCPADIWKRVTRITERFQHQAEHRKTKIWISLTSMLKDKAANCDEDSLTAVLFVLMELSNLKTRLPSNPQFDCILKVSEQDLATNGVSVNEVQANNALPAYESESEYESSNCSEESNEPECPGTISADSGAGNSPDLEFGPTFPPELPNEIDFHNYETDLVVQDQLPYWIQWDQKPKFVSEQTLMTEAIWMLLGNKDVFLFQWTGNRFYVREGTHLIDLSQETLESVFSHICECGKYMVEMQDFCEKMSVSNVSRILQAFVLSLKQSIQVVRKRLILLEKEVTDEDNSITMMVLLERLRPIQSIIVTLWGLLQNGIIQRPTNVNTTWCQSLHLLGSLYKAATEEDKIHGQKRLHFTMLVNIFLDTCKSFVDFMDQLLTEGQIDDPHDEFIIERFTDVTNLNCENVLVFREVPSQYQEGFFLCDVLQEVILASCLTVILKENASWEPSYSNTSECLSAKFTTLCQKKLNFSECVQDNTIFHAPASQTNKIESTDLSTITIFLSKFDPLLKANFAKIFPFPPLNQDTKNENEEVEEANLLPKFEESLNLLLADMLSSLVSEKCEFIHRKVMEVLKGDLFVQDHLLVIRKYFLLENGDEMNTFSKKLAKMIMKSQFLRSAKSVPLLFERIISESKVKHMNLLTLTIDLEVLHPESMEPLDVLLALRLSYSAPSPVNLILSQKSMTIYQDIFCFLMKLNCAKASLDMLRFNDLDNEDISFTSQKPECMFVFIFRMHLLHLIGKLHMYFLTGLLQTKQQSFGAALDAASSFHQLLCTHQDHLEDLQQFCLLSPSCVIFSRIICNILNLAISFASAWNEHTLTLGMKQMVMFENDFHSHVWAFNRTSTLFLRQLVSKVRFKQLQFSDFVTLCGVFSSQMLVPRPVLDLPTVS